MMIDAMSRIFYVFPNLRNHPTQTFPEIKWKVKELTKFKMCKQSKVTGFEGRESTLTSNEPGADY